MRVTVEGSNTPSTFLARGARVTVERTPYIEKLIRKGYVKVVATPPVVEEIRAAVEPQLEATAAERRLVQAPFVSALKSEWAEFLDSQNVAYPENATKTEMIARWRELTGAEDDEGEPTDG